MLINLIWSKIGQLLEQTFATLCNMELSQQDLLSCLQFPSLLSSSDGDSMENLNPEQKDNDSQSSKFLHRCTNVGMMIINSYVTMLSFLQIPVQMNLPKAEQKYTFF